MLVKKITPPLFQPYLIREENRAFIEGRSNKVFTSDFSSTGLILIVLFWISMNIIVSILTFQRVYNEWIEVSSLISSSITTKGTIINKRMVTATDPEDSDDYYLTYEFIANNKQKIRDEASTNFGAYYNYEYGDKISVRYVGNNPFISRPYQSDIDMLLSLLYLNFSMLLLNGIMIIFSIAFIYSVRIDWIFKHRKGEIIQGTLVSASAKEGSDNDLKVTFNYNFYTPDGHNITNSTIETRNDLKDKNLPPNGTQLAVLYINDKIYTLL